MKHVKKLMLKPDPLRAKILLNLSKSKLRIVTMLMTGHGIFKSHLLKMKLVKDENCRFCNTILKETATHLLCDCRKFDYERVILFGKSSLSLKDYSVMDFKDFMLYLKCTKLIERLAVYDIKT